MSRPADSRILLVDDDPVGAELTLAALEAVLPGVGVDLAGDGEEALEHLDRRRDGRPPPHAVLLDLKMPKVDGHEVLRQIRTDSRLRNLRVVVLTSSDRQRDRETSAFLGTDHYLVKPPSLLALIEQLRACAPLLAPGSASPRNP
jgi:two-component system response regulator